MVTDISKFRERVEFINLVRTPNDSGGYNEADSTLFERWARVKVDTGNRGQEAERTVIGRRAKMWCRFTQTLAEGLTKDTRIIWNNQRWTIQGYTLIENTPHIYQFELAAVE